MLGADSRGMTPVGLKRTCTKLAAVVAAGALVAGCAASDGDQSAGASDSTATTASAATGGATSPANPCTIDGVPSPPEATAVAESPSDWDVTSFDGTTIRAHWFPLEGASADQPAPTVLMGPGWSLPGDTDVDAIGVLGAINISSLRDAGFNVLTWDPRGFGASSGQAEVNSADFEGRDVQALLDWVAARPEAQVDQPGDPRSGMIGGSYGGGIQLITAAIDCRVDAIVPVIAWSSLGTSLYKSETVKSGWSGILVQVTATRPVNPHTTSSYESGQATGTLSDEDEAWFLARGPADLVNDITVPTLLIQGTVDGLFTLEEGVTNYEILDGNGVPVSMLWFCGGHGVCLTDPGDEARTGVAGINWLRRYVQGDTSIDTGPRLDIIDQRGTRFTADGYPAPTGTPITATGSGTLSLVAEGGSGPGSAPEGGGGLLATLVLPVTPAKATNAIDVAIPTPDEALVQGAPEVTLTYSGKTPDGVKPTRVFAQLVDDETGLVLGNVVTPIPVTLDGQSHTVTIPLEIVAFTTTPGSSITLQLVATTVAYGEPRLGGSVEVSTLDVRLPTADLEPQAG